MNNHNENNKQEKYLTDLSKDEIILAHIGENEDLSFYKFFKIFNSLGFLVS